jgi:hypothetical protein
MLKRFDWSDRSAAAAILLGLVAVYLPWYGYASGTAHVAVNAFRASILGDAFFLLIGAEALLVLMGQGIVSDVVDGRITERAARTAVAGTAAAILVIQLALIASAGRTAAAGMLVAVLSVVALALSAWVRRYHAEPRRTVREMLGEELPD